MSEHHYYATWALGWATADTREEAIERLVDAFRSDFKTIVKNSHKNGELGAYVWSVKVLAPSDTPYKIEYYTPKGVDLEDAQEHAVTYVTNKEVAYGRNYKADYDALKRKMEATAEDAA